MTSSVTDEIYTALNRVAPAMPGGFSILTSYGALEVTPGDLADAVAKLVRKHFEAELAKLPLEQA